MTEESYDEIKNEFQISLKTPMGIFDKLIRAFETETRSKLTAKITEENNSALFQNIQSYNLGSPEKIRDALVFLELVAKELPNGNLTKEKLESINRHAEKPMSDFDAYVLTVCYLGYKQIAKLEKAKENLYKML